MIKDFIEAAQQSLPCGYIISSLGSSQFVKVITDGDDIRSSISVFDTRNIETFDRASEIVRQYDSEKRGIDKQSAFLGL